MRAKTAKAPSRSKYYGDTQGMSRSISDSSLMQNLGMYMNPGRVNPNSGLLALLSGATTRPVRKKYRR